MISVIICDYVEIIKTTEVIVAPARSDILILSQILKSTVKDGDLLVVGGAVILVL